MIDLGQAADMGINGSVGRYRLGTLLGGDEGAAYVSRAREAMAAEEIKAPERWAQLIVPGRWAGSDSKA
jgi:hypothetical protein